MALIIVTIVAFLLGIGFIFLSNYLSAETGRDFGITYGVGLTLFCGSFVMLIIEAVILILTYIGVPGDTAQYWKRFESLTYQIETGMYNNLTENGKKELYNDVERWNSDLAYRKAMEHDFWIGAFYPNIYDQFEFIEYPKG